MLKRITIGLIVMSVALMTASGASASGVCLFRIGYTCIFWSGGVVGNLNAVGTQVGDYLGFSIEPHPVLSPDNPAYPDDPNSPEKLVEVIVFCGNHGNFNNVAKGVNPGTILGKLDAYDVVRKQDERNGKVTDFEVHWVPDDDALSQADPVCWESMNPNWEAVDLVPIAWSGDVALLDEEGEVEATKRLCHTLPDPDGLEWDQKAKMPEKQIYNTTECP